MKNTLTYQDNDPTYGLVNAKPKAAYTGKDLKKEVWKPKTSLKWTEPYRAPLSLQ